MFKRVLVGVDGRAGGRDAIALAQQLVTSSTRLILANVYGTSALRGAAGAGWEAEHAHHLLTCTRQDHGLECRTVVRLDSSPGRGLHRLAEHERADLLVVGSSHRGGLGRVVIGDGSLAALNGARCAVAIAPRGFVFASPAWTRIGVGDDGSPEGAVALAAAHDLARLHNAEVTVLTAQTDPARELDELAHSVDLLVVGSRGQGTLGRLANGSVSGHLARHSACPLLVMPRGLRTRPVKRRQAVACRWDEPHRVARGKAAKDGRPRPRRTPQSRAGRSKRKRRPRLTDHLEILACPQDQHSDVGVV